MVALSTAPTTDPVPHAVEMEVIDWRNEVEARLDAEAIDPETTALPGGHRREHVIAQIRAMNPSATREMLSGFTDGALDAYLAHLKLAAAPRGPQSRWLRPADSRGVTCYQPDSD